MYKVKGVISARYDNEKNVALVVNGAKYTAYMGKGIPSEAQKGAEVEFDAIDKGDFKNVKGSFKVLGTSSSTGGHSPSSSSGSRAGYSNLGVELGHAANLAWSMMVNKTDPTKQGDDAFYAEFVTHTEKVYKVMKGLRKKFEEGKDAAPSAPTPAPVAEPVADDDIF